MQSSHRSQTMVPRPPRRFVTGERAIGPLDKGERNVEKKVDLYKMGEQLVDEAYTRGYKTERNH